MKSLILLAILLAGFSICFGQTFEWVPSDFKNGIKWQLIGEEHQGEVVPNMALYARSRTGGHVAPVVPVLPVHRYGQVYKKEPVVPTFYKKLPVVPSFQKKVPGVHASVPVGPSFYKKTPKPVPGPKVVLQGTNPWVKAPYQVPIHRYHSGRH